MHQKGELAACMDRCVHCTHAPRSCPIIDFRNNCCARAGPGPLTAPSFTLISVSAAGAVNFLHSGSSSAAQQGAARSDASASISVSVSVPLPLAAARPVMMDDARVALATARQHVAVGGMRA